jgi:Flp pilus assembly protein TadG
MKLIRRISKSEKGQSFIELGASMLVLLIILAGVVEIGMFMFQYIAMRDAAQEGAMYASIYPTACNQTIERVKKDLYNVDPTQIDVTVTINGAQCTPTVPNACASKVVDAYNEVRVTIHQPNYRITMPFLGTFLGRQTLDISATTTSTIIRPPCP